MQANPDTHVNGKKKEALVLVDPPTQDMYECFSYLTHGQSSTKMFKHAF
jgi:hypothetical protein